MPARRRLTPQAFYRTLHRIADGKIGEAEAAFLRVIDATGRSVDTGRLHAALDRITAEFQRQVAAGERLSIDPSLLDDVLGAAGVTTALPAQVQARFTGMLRRIVIEAGVATAALTPPSISFRFDITNPRATTFARRQSSRFVRDLAKDARKAIRREIATGFREGRTVAQTAREIRRVVGLSDQHVKWIGNFRGDWLPDMNARALDGRPLLAKHKRRLRQLQSRFPTQKAPFTEAEMRGLVDKYRERLLRQRAEEVARTETIRASAGGQVEAWQQQADSGLIDTRVFRVGWSFTKDALTSCSCKSIPRLNPRGVPLGKPFKMEDCRTGEIRLVRLPGDTHRLCRCSLVAVYHMDQADVEVVA